MVNQSDDRELAAAIARAQTGSEPEMLAILFICKLRVRHVSLGFHPLGFLVGSLNSSNAEEIGSAVHFPIVE